ncbi:tRNA-specific 2-thiouridylase MnmA [Rhynchospora pubera]|uniref:tRNA-5-taurinomethyluridine 2-sulfurtransferase n=1 Tax=Rhynchospora pubera TaxID=906938 RepID=A0AAV8C730_9POAL|nr:tRNA-specific 2-thiouridylase MnmA [Rhynchospora pubera]
MVYGEHSKAQVSWAQIVSNDSRQSERSICSERQSGRNESMRRAMVTAVALPLSLPFPKPNTPLKPNLIPPPSPLPPPFSLSTSRLIFPKFRWLSSSTSALLTSPTPFLSPPPKNVVDFDVEPYLACSMPGKRLRVAVLLSGGVDSSVALRLLHAAGHECTAFYLKIWFQEDFKNFWSECPWDEDLKYARAVCDSIDVPLEVVHLSDEYWDNVVSYIINEYRCGRTPNPDVLCNTRIKFGAFLEAVQKMEFDYIASGHYAHVIHSAPDNPSGPSMLKLSRDMVKDQTYFLSHLSQSQLERLLFPLGCMQKDQVRTLATLMDLPNKDRKDSQGICFLGKVKFSEFVEMHIGEKEGVMLEAETGDYLGNHRGFWFYTIGQRQGLRLPGGPWYVVGKDTQHNVVFVSRKYFSLDKRRRTFRVGSLTWFSGFCPSNNEKIRCKVRHGPGFYDCSIKHEPSKDDKYDDCLEVHLNEDDQGLAAGQFAAFYHGDICLGSGIILDSCDAKTFPICSRALELAKLEDKSKLGKPVRIMNL